MNARAAQAAPHHRRIRRCRRRQDQARRSLRLNRPSPTGIVWSATPLRPPARLRHRHQQGVHRRRPALQRPYPRMACDRGHGRGQDRFLLRRSGQQACDAWSMAKAVSFARSRSRTDYTGVRSAGRASWRGSAKAAGGRCETGLKRGVGQPGSLLVVILLIDQIVFIIVVSLKRRRRACLWPWSSQSLR